MPDGDRRVTPASTGGHGLDTTAGAWSVIGIPVDAQERIFEPFYRLEVDEAQPGTGIGLAIVRRSVRAMEGDVRVTSQPGTGSTFIVSLPAA